MARKIRRNELSAWIGVNNGYFSQILNGEREIGKKTARRIAARVGKPWAEIMDLEGSKIEAEILAAYREKVVEAAINEVA